MEKMLAIWACAAAVAIAAISFSIAWVQVEEARAGITQAKPCLCSPDGGK